MNLAEEAEKTAPRAKIKQKRKHTQAHMRTHRFETLTKREVNRQMYVHEHAVECFSINVKHQSFQIHTQFTLDRLVRCLLRLFILRPLFICFTFCLLI